MCAPPTSGASRDCKERSRSRATACRVAHWPLNFPPGHAWKWTQRAKVRRSPPGAHRTPHGERADGSFATHACALHCRSRVAREPAQTAAPSPLPTWFSGPATSAIRRRIHQEKQRLWKLQLGCRHSSDEMANASVKPSVVTSPVTFPPRSKASGIIVSASIVSTAPPAKASTKATVRPDASSSSP